MILFCKKILIDVTKIKKIIKITIAKKISSLSEILCNSIPKKSETCFLKTEILKIAVVKGIIEPRSFYHYLNNVKNLIKFFNKLF